MGSDNMPFFTIAMPIFNAEKYLNESISSIIMQTEKDFELVLVDDGSKDNSVGVCLEWINKYPNLIRLIKKENTGSLLTRRKCLEEAKGQYIYIMDADDYLIDKDALKKIKQNIKNNNCDLLFFNSTIKETREPFDNYPFKNMQIFENDSLNEIYKIVMSGDGFNALWNKVFSRELVDWDEDYTKYVNVTNGTDMLQMIPIVFNAKRILYCSDVYYYYRFSSNTSSIVHTFKPTIYTSLRENFKRLINITEKYQIDIKDIDEILALRFMKIASTSAYKVNLIKKNDNYNGVAYLSMIGNDDLFKTEYRAAKLRELQLARRIIVVLLYLQKYKMLNILIHLFKV